MDSFRAIQAQSNTLEKRQYTYGYGYRRYNRWSGWGRWVLLGVILGVALLVLLLFACISARRRRKFGRKPYMGTGWAAPNTGAAPAYNNNTKPTTYQTQPQMEQGYNNNNQSTYNNNQQPYYSGGGQANDYYNGSTNGAQTGGYQPPSYPPPAQTRA